MILYGQRHEQRKSHAKEEAYVNGEKQRNDQRLGNMDKDKKLCKTTLIAHILFTLRYHLK